MKNPDQYTIVGTSVPRVDITAKITGGAAYLQDFSVPGMLHGRVVRPAGVGATLQNLDEGSVTSLPGIVKVVRNGNFVGVVAEREEQAINAARQLKVTWQSATTLPKMEDLFTSLRAQTATDKSLKNDGDVDGALASAAKTLAGDLSAALSDARGHRPLVRGRGCAGGQGDDLVEHAGRLSSCAARSPNCSACPPTPCRSSHMEGSGCYGHNGFDDAAADAALLSKAVGKPVRVQWMRQDEHAWEPKGPAMVMEVKGGLDAQGNVVAWDYGVWTPTHSTRPGGMAGNLLAGQLIAPPAPAAKNGTTGGDRNAPTNYTFKNNRVVAHWLATSPLRPSALRSLGGIANTFANESFMDELAAAAGSDPVAFRLRHLNDARAIAVVQKVADLAGWQSRPSPGPDAGGNGRGERARRRLHPLREQPRLLRGGGGGRGRSGQRAGAGQTGERGARLRSDHQPGRSEESDRGECHPGDEPRAERAGDLRPIACYECGLALLSDPHLPGSADGGHRPDQPAA